MRPVNPAWRYACLILISLIGVVCAAPPGPESADTARENIISQLDLTAEQKTAIEERRMKREKLLNDLFAKITALRQRIQEEFKKPALDKERVISLHRETKELMNQVMDIHFQSLVEVRELLTPAQHAKMMKLFDTISKDLPSPSFPSQQGVH
ncbi:MAG TPA: Spy/CpxP family protein refolding chaperone [Candidatus Ozemobacteraceae bacterium]|nr:Spy/CpxP family protein refolding chaperone [Candidatus Ozemobacteraceae bacterium]